MLGFKLPATLNPKPFLGPHSIKARKMWGAQGGPAEPSNEPTTHLGPGRVPLHRNLGAQAFKHSSIPYDYGSKYPIIK